MSFDSAIPLNRIAHMQQTGFESSARREQGAPDEHVPMYNPKQRVNISEDTLMRIARGKLAQAMNQKVSYNRRGAFSSSDHPVGQMLSAKA